MKLLYLAERESLRRFTATITQCRFFILPKGPVLSEVLDLMYGKVESEIWQAHIAFTRYSPGSVSENTTSLRKPIDARSYLSGVEIKILEEVWEKHKSQDKWELVHLTHEFPEWDERALKDSTSISIPLVDIFEKGLHEEHDRAKARAEDAEYYQRILV